jgi:multiple sugar transport system permease protein
VTALTSSLGSLTGRVTTRIDRLSDRRFALLTFLPGLILVALFVIPPIIAVIVMSGFRIELLKTSAITFNFPNNFTRLTIDTDFLDAIPRTVLYGAGVTLLSVPLALFTAIVLNRRFRGASILGVAVLLPWAVAQPVTGEFWKFIFQSHYGLATSVAIVLGLTDRPIDWLFNTNFAVAIGVIATTWNLVPLYALLLLAALKTIPDSLYRAAKMDGASSWQSFRYVTIPGISRFLLIVAVLAVITALQILGVLFTLTRGGPGHDTTVLIYYVYQNLTGLLSFGYSAAMAIALLVGILAFTALLWLPRIRARKESVSEDEIESLSSSSIRFRTGAFGSDRAAAEEWVERRRRFVLPPWVGRVATAIAAGVLLVWLVGPILWVFITSLVPEGYITQAPPRLEGFSFDSYTNLLGLKQFSWAGSAVVSLEVTLLTTLFTVLFGALAAYPLARLEVPGRGLVTAAIVFTQTVPSIVVAIPTLLIFRQVGLNDTVAGLVLADTAFLLPLVVWLLKNVFEGVPRALESAARIDGCSRLGALFRITMPAAAPGVAAIIILTLIAIWNEFTFAVILGSKNTVTLTRLIGFIDIGSVGAQGPPPFTVLAAAGIIAIAPCLVLVILFHRRVVAGITEGFVKG